MKEKQCITSQSSVSIKKTHSKLKNVVVIALVTDFSSSSLYFYFRFVFFAGDIQDRSPKRAEFFRVSISLFLHFQNSHVRHLFLTAIQCDLIKAEMVVVDKNTPGCLWFLYKCKLGDCHIQEAVKWLKVL